MSEKRYSSVFWDPVTQHWIKFGSSHQAEVYYNTTEGWNKKIGVVSEKNVIYVYTDYTENSPGIKIGDGLAYIIDLPFITGDYETLARSLSDHINDDSIHVTPEEKAFWNSKHKAFVTGETIVFTDL